jgi:DNA-binding beta-propeller fold protein YncE
VFNVCEQIDKKCNTNAVTLAEIVTVSTDGESLIYTDGTQQKIGFVDISDIFAPKALGTIDVKGEPTSVATKDGYALAAVNTSPDFINTSGDLVVINIASQKIIARIPLGGQPDSIAVSPDGKYAVIAIENERNEALGTGAPPQMPAGFVSIAHIANSNPLKWSVN